MDHRIQSKSHWSFWVIGGVGLVWYMMGVLNLVGQMSEAMLENYSDVARVIVDNQPWWATIGFAIGMIGGVVGCLLLVLKMPIAYYVFIASFLGIIVQLTFGLRFVDLFGAGEIIGYVTMPILVAVFLMWYSKRQLR